MAPGNRQDGLDQSQRLLIAAVLAAAGVYSSIIWFTGGGAQDGFSAIALTAGALYVAFCRVQSTSSLLAELKSDRKPSPLAVVLHLTALAFFLASLAAWLT